MNTQDLAEWKKVYENDLSYVASELKERIEPPSVLILTGDLGAGKTTFAKTFSGDPNLISPTYSIINENSNILHADLYRLKETDEITQLELELCLEDKQFFLVEWGIEYVRALYREVPEEFDHFYQLEIVINRESENPNRDYFLRKLILD